MDSTQKGPVMRKEFPCHDVIMDLNLVMAALVDVLQTLSSRQNSEISYAFVRGLVGITMVSDPVD